MGLRKLLFDAGKGGIARDLALALLRVALAGTMALQHGWPKLARWSELSAKFPDPLGVGPAASLALAIFGELVCGALLAVGLMGRLAALPLAATMAVAAFVHHGGDPFRDKELALVYLVGFVTLALTGPGRVSIDGLLGRK